MNIKINEKYIIKRTENNYAKHQYVTIDGSFVNSEDNVTYYTYTYGYFGFHEGWCSIDNIMELTDEQKQYSSKNEFWKLPQEFYQSMPE